MCMFLYIKNNIFLSHISLLYIKSNIFDKSQTHKLNKLGSQLAKLKKLKVCGSCKSFLDPVFCSFHPSISCLKKLTSRNTWRLLFYNFWLNWSLFILFFSFFENGKNVVESYKVLWTTVRFTNQMKSNNLFQFTRYSFNLTALTFFLKTPIVLFQRLTLPERWQKIRFAPLPWETGWFFIRKRFTTRRTP